MFTKKYSTPARSKGRERDSSRCRRAQAVGPAAVEALRHDEHVDGHAEQQAAQQTADQAQALVVHKLLIHGAILLFFNGNVSNTGRIRRWYVYGTCTVRI